MRGAEDERLDDVRYPYIYQGTVVDRDDPEQLGRVRFVVPGLIEPRSPWAYPAATVGGGSQDAGFFAVPEVGAEVYVFFVAGDIDEPRYLCGHWGSGEVPSEARRSPPTNRVFSSTRFVIELDEDPTQGGVRITNRVTGDSVKLDALTSSIEIKGTVAIRIQCVGMIELKAPVLQLNGRPVLPSGTPI